MSRDNWSEDVRRAWWRAYWSAKRDINNHHTAEDIASAVVTKLLASLGRINDIEKTTAYAARITSNTIIDEIRIRKRERTLIGKREGDVQSLPTQEMAAHEMPRTNQEWESVWQAILARPRKEQMLLARVLVYNETCSDVAKDVGLKPEAARKQVLRVKMDLQKQYVLRAISARPREEQGLLRSVIVDGKNCEDAADESGFSAEAARKIVERFRKNLPKKYRQDRRQSKTCDSDASKVGSASPTADERKFKDDRTTDGE